MKVKFILTPEIVGDATDALLLGDFNNWDPNAGIGLKVQKDGTLAATVTLEPGKTYQYRYFLSDGRWVNDANAAQYAFDAVFHIDNCVITVPAEEVKAVKAEKAAKAPKVVKAEKAPKAGKAPKADDLTKIEGIGKKIAELLKAAEITSFASLSKATPKKLKEILDAAGPKFNVHEPASWPKQAKLAAAAKWDELSTLQDSLKGGK